jgi:hypothetical protein
VVGERLTLNLGNMLKFLLKCTEIYCFVLV